MSRRTNRKIARDAFHLAWAAPEVVARRMTQLWLAGANPSRRDRAELHRMSAEKIGAFYDSWNAMLLEIMRANVRLALSWPSASTAVFAAGLAPIRRRAVANAKRLRRVRV